MLCYELVYMCRVERGTCSPDTVGEAPTEAKHAPCGTVAGCSKDMNCSSHNYRADGRWLSHSSQRMIDRGSGNQCFIPRALAPHRVYCHAIPAHGSPALSRSYVDGGNSSSRMQPLSLMERYFKAVSTSCNLSFTVLIAFFSTFAEATI